MKSRRQRSLAIAFLVFGLARAAETSAGGVALDFHQRAHAIQERWAPNAIDKAVTLQHLGRLHRRMGHPGQASQLLAQAVNALGRPTPAFHLVERSRQDNAARYDQALRELARWTPEAGEPAREGLHRELSRLRRERDEIAAEIREASPRLAALRQPQPLDLDAARFGDWQ